MRKDYGKANKSSTEHMTVTGFEVPRLTSARLFQVGASLLRLMGPALSEEYGMELSQRTFCKDLHIRDPKRPGVCLLSNRRFDRHEA